MHPSKIGHLTMVGELIFVFCY